MTPPQCDKKGSTIGQNTILPTCEQLFEYSVRVLKITVIPILEADHEVLPEIRVHFFLAAVVSIVARAVINIV